MTTAVATVEVAESSRKVAQQGATGARRAIPEGITALMYACQQNNSSEVRRLIQRKPSSVSDRDRTGKTALHFCAENPTVTCAEELLIADPTLVNVSDEEGYTALHLTVINGNKILSRFLISRDADLNAIDNEKHSVIHWAVVCGELECLDVLIESGAWASTPDIHGAYPLHYAAQMCGPNSEMGHDVRVGLTVLKRLLARGVPVNVVDQDERTPLLWAASAGSSDAIVALVNAGSQVTSKDKDGLAALHCAASRGQNECLETLITLCGAEVDALDNNGCTALFYAVTLGHADCTSTLLRFGGEANRQDQKARTPAHCGAAKGQLETLKILEKNGADLWMKNSRGDLPLHEAVHSGRKDLVRWLLELRPETVNAANTDGRTCLHIAAINDNIEMCKVLIDCKAAVNPIMKNSKRHSMTPVDAALYRGNRGCAKYLQLHGGVPASKLGEQPLLKSSNDGLSTIPSSPTPSHKVDSMMQTLPVPELMTRSESKHEGIQTEDEVSLCEDKGIQTADGRVREASYVDNRDGTSQTDVEEKVGKAVQTAALMVDSQTDTGREVAEAANRAPADGAESRVAGKEVSLASSSEISEMTLSSVQHKDSGYSDNDRRRLRTNDNRSDGDSDVLSSPTGDAITFIDNGEVKMRQPRRTRRQVVRKDRGGKSRSQPDSDSEVDKQHGRRRVNSDDSKGDSRRSKKSETRGIFRPRSLDNKRGTYNHPIPENLRRYQKERRIFQELLELKRVQINSGRSDEEFIVKKLADNYRHQGLVVSGIRFEGPYTFRSYEKYLYEQLRQLSTLNGVDKVAAYTSHHERFGHHNFSGKLSETDDPTKCTHRTYHCHHAAHTYMGVPCVAFLKPNRPTLPKINSNLNTSNQNNLKDKQKDKDFLKDKNLSNLNPKDPVTLEIKHGSQIQKFTLPTNQLDANKRYQLTFTIGPSSKDKNTSEMPAIKSVKNAL